MATRQLISFDWALKRLLRNEATFPVLEGFLSELLRDEIKIIKMIETESLSESADSKVTRVDMKVRDHLGRQILIELQHTRQGDFLQRMLYYASQAVSGSLSKGKSYSDVERVVSINIVYFDVGIGSDYVYVGRNEFRGMHLQDVLRLTEEQKRVFGCDQVAEIFPEYYILRVNRFNDQVRDALDEWMYFLKNENIPDDFDAKGLQQAKEELDVLKLPDAERRKYERFQDDLHQQASLYEEHVGKWIESQKKLEKSQQELEKTEQQLEKTEQELEEERRQKEEVQQQLEEARRQKEKLSDHALQALMSAGMSKAQACQALGL